MAKKQLKLYIWKEVLTDYTDGVIFAMAHNVEEARRVVIEDAYDDHACWEESTLWKEMSKPPEVHKKPHGFHVWGGG